MAAYVIEISGPQNESVIFPPTRERLRGRWDFSKTHHRDKNDAMKVLATQASVIPGVCVMIDTEKRTGLIFDSLETDEGKKILERLNGAAGRFEHVFGSGWKAWPRREYQLTPDDLKTWAHFMRQLCDDGLASAIKPLPTRQQIAGWPGRRRRDPGNTGQQAEKLSEFVDVVSSEAELVESGPTESKGKK